MNNETNTSSDQGNRISMKPIEKKSLYLKISDSIYRYIQMNNLQPGDKLPSESDMSSMLQTSRNSVREALRILEDRGLIYVKTGSGVFINNPYGENNSLTIQLTNCTLTEMEELQNALDHEAVKNAMERGTIQEKDQLLATATEMVRLASELQESKIQFLKFICNYSNKVKSGNGKRQEKPCRQMDRASKNFTEVSLRAKHRKSLTFFYGMQF